MGKKKGGVRIKQVGPKMPPGGLMNPMEELMQGLPNSESQDPRFLMPIMPDRSYQVFWPMHQTFSMDTKGFQVIYPSYLDADKTVQQGRRIGREQAVSTPTVMDLSQGLQAMGLRHVIQPYKGYSRDITCLWDNPGRLLVDVVSSTMNKKQLLLELAKRLALLPERQARLARLQAEREAEQQEREKEMAAKAAAAAATTTTTSAATSTSSNKKKGKKGRKK